MHIYLSFIQYKRLLATVLLTHNYIYSGQLYFMYLWGRGIKNKIVKFSWIGYMQYIADFKSCAYIDFVFYDAISSILVKTLMITMWNFTLTKEAVSIYFSGQWHLEIWFPSSFCYHFCEGKVFKFHLLYKNICWGHYLS